MYLLKNKAKKMKTVTPRKTYPILDPALRGQSDQALIANVLTQS